MAGRPLGVPAGVDHRHILWRPRHISLRTAGSWSSSSKALSHRRVTSGLPVERNSSVPADPGDSPAMAGMSAPVPEDPESGLEPLPPAAAAVDDENIHERSRLMAKCTSWTRNRCGHYQILK